MEVLDQGARHPLGSQVQIVLVRERGVGGREAGGIGVDAVRGEPPVERGDGGADRVQMRKAVDDGCARGPFATSEPPP